MGPKIEMRPRISRVNADRQFFGRRWAERADGRLAAIRRLGNRRSVEAVGRWLLAVVLVTGLVARADEKKPEPAPAPSRWGQIEAAMGAMSPDGTLRRRFSLGESAELKALGVRLEMEHRVETDAWGRARSAWRVRGLQTSLAPTGREHLLWQPPAVAAVKFERAQIGRALSAAGASRWRIREAAPGEFEVRSLDGQGWGYAQGNLVSAFHPALGELRCTTQGGWITTIRRAENGSDEPPLLAARYDDNGQFIGCVIGGQRPQSFIMNENSQLQSWLRADGAEVRFAYRDGLLSEIAEPGQPVRTYAWKENPGYERGDARWAAPVHLAADEANTYNYDVAQQGFVMRRRENVTGRETVTIYNPRRRRIEQQSGGETLLATFRGGTLGRGALERIVDGRGELLEDYRYDGRGQLVKVVRKGEPERAISYDEAGRVFSFEEVSP